MSVIHAYLAKPSNSYSYERLAAEVKAYFDFETKNGLSIGTSANPFTREKYEILRWPGWSFTAHFETGPNVEADANHVASVVRHCSPEVKERTERIRFVFSPDKTREYTNHMVWAVDFLLAIPGAIVFDESGESIMRLVTPEK
ncbi:hypothetical protein [Collimonas sp. OK412]|jgi:hypothetical protein|uniref:hypothetical protein n=1 Tax=Collimonas sp. (strain OK412) TaxID=1801619 RepID=UPI0008F1D714|nr:hypothetical protein [Collimonas sp. OK412]SFC92792.1 hypothetical protein SAMN04515619_11692 [Collimonas sp. OK412]